LDAIHKILLYAPGNEEGLEIMKGILQELDLKEESSPSSSSSTNINSNSNNGWRLLPMISRDLQASHLGDLLEHALKQAREVTPDGGVVFLGMDSPVLALDDIVNGLVLAKSTSNTALLCPADDGGYGMLCVPPNVPSSRVFRGVQWSHSLTAVSQLKALTDQNIAVTIGTLMQDIDEPEDVQRLCQRLQTEDDDSKKKNGMTEDGEPMVLSLCSGGVLSCISSHHPLCYHTRKALVESGLLSC
jgi:hypothetical protein